MPGAANLLTRAARLLPRDDPQRLALLSDAARPLRTSGRTADALAVLLETIERAGAVGDVVVEWRARLELAYLRAYSTSDDDANAEMLRVAENAIASLAGTQDNEGLSLAWKLIAYARVALGDLKRAGIAFGRARRYALRLPSSPYDAAIVWGIASVYLEGPTPLDVAIARCRELLDYRGQTQPGVMFELAVLLAMRHEFAEARELLVRAAANVRERGVRRPPLFLALASARVELAANETGRAEEHARHGLELGAALGGDEADAENAIVLAQVLCRQQRFDEAEEVVAGFAGKTSYRDIARTASWNALRAEIRAYRGAWGDAVELAGRAVAGIDQTDFINVRAELRLTLAAMLRGAGNATDSERVAIEAMNLFQAKGSPVGVERARNLLHREAQAAVGLVARTARR